MQFQDRAGSVSMPLLYTDASFGLVPITVFLNLKTRSSFPKMSVLHVSYFLQFAWSFILHFSNSHKSCYRIQGCSFGQVGSHYSTKQCSNQNAKREYVHACMIFFSLPFAQPDSWWEIICACWRSNSAPLCLQSLWNAALSHPIPRLRGDGNQCCLAACV